MNRSPRRYSRMIPDRSIPLLNRRSSCSKLSESRISTRIFAHHHLHRVYVIVPTARHFARTETPEDHPRTGQYTALAHAPATSSTAKVTSAPHCRGRLHVGPIVTHTNFGHQADLWPPSHPPPPGHPIV